MSLNTGKLYEFGPYRLDKQKRQLWRDGQTVSLTAKAMEILVSLVERRGQVVSKNDLMETLWPNSYVEEGNLTQNVFLLRKALGETARDHNYIVTVPGTGYRFAADVREVVNGNGEVRQAATIAALLAPTGTAAASYRAVARPKHWLWMGVAGVLLLASAAAYLGWRFLRPGVRPSGQRVVLAVLPFLNLTGDARQDYFSDGFTEEMITQLGRLDPQRLGVIARTSVMRYRNSQGRLEQIGRDLGADYVLEGSVRRDSQKVRITAQLIQARDQTHVWARQYDRELTNLLDLQSAIAQEIAGEIEHTLGGGHQRTRAERLSARPPKTYEAYDHYLKGRYFWNKRTPDGIQQAIRCFQQAIAQDPDYARAYAGLADSYVLMSGYSLAPASDFMPEARAAALHALELDEGLAEAHASLALIAQNYDWDWPTAEKEYRRAIQLDPNYATAHHWYAEHLALQGRFEEAFPEIERARQLDPLSLIMATDQAAFFYFARQYDRAIELFRTVLEMEPNFPRARMIVYAYVEKGRFADALADVENWSRIEKGPWIWSLRAYVYGRSGQSAKARQAMTRLQRAYRSQDLDPAPMMVAELGQGKHDKALAWLHEAYLKHSSALTALKVDPTYDPLRSEPRFQELMRGVGLAH
jgi:TolB-like protein/DNA-binding winged helix-turn-helix (wHTH) protein/Tfp pilus assembly protein PilF